MARRTQIDRRLAEALAEGLTHAKAAKAAGCSESTVKRRWAEPAFRELVREIQAEQRHERTAALMAFWQRGQQMLPLGLAAIFDVLQDRNASARDKLHATRVLFSQFAPPVPPPAPAIPSELDDAIASEIQQLQRLALLAAQTLPSQPRRSAMGSFLPPEVPAVVTIPPPLPVVEVEPEPEPQEPEPRSEPEPVPAVSMRRPPRGIEAVDAAFERRMRGR